MRRLTALFVLLLAGPATSSAADRLCDTAYEDCRTPLLELIRNERVGVDVAFWFMEDARHTAALARKIAEGVPVRVLVDTRANSSYTLNADRLRELRETGIPMRRRIASGILHWKMMLFEGQNTVQFSAATTPLRSFRTQRTTTTSTRSSISQTTRRWSTASGRSTTISGPTRRRIPITPTSCIR